MDKNALNRKEDPIATTITSNTDTAKRPRVRAKVKLTSCRKTGTILLSKRLYHHMLELLGSPLEYNVILDRFQYVYEYVFFSSVVHKLFNNINAFSKKKEFIATIIGQLLMPHKCFCCPKRLRKIEPLSSV